jgi:hypothetical protein
LHFSPIYSDPDFWRGRSESLISRWPLIFILFARGSLHLLRTPLGGIAASGQRNIQKRLADDA